MNKKIVVIFICTLLIVTALQTLGTKNTSITPNDPDFNQQWHLDNNGQYGGTIDSDIDTPEAWEIETGDYDVVIALVDTGVDYTHPDLAENIWINNDEIPDNGIDDDENGFIDDVMGWDFCFNDNDPKDECGHGTHCAGIAAAVTNNNIGIAGVCWNCKIMVVQTGTCPDPLDIHKTIEGIRYATDNGADIISMSFAWINPPDYEGLKDAIDYAYDKGVLLVAAAGNGGRTDKHYPAAYENVIAVTATNNTDEGMYYEYEQSGMIVKSNYGSWVDVAAPGQEIYSTFPTYPVYYNDFFGVNQNYDNLSGTSMTAPCVAGLAALLISRDSTLSQEEVKTLICENVDPYDSEYDLGSGRINAYKALSALNTPPNKPVIDGLTSGNIGEEQEFNISTTDPHNDDIYYIINWSDDSGEVTIGPFASGEVQTVTHIWNEEGDYSIKVKAKDTLGAESDWGTLDVTMPKTKAFNIPLFFQRLFQCFPFFEKILNQIIQ